MPRIDLTQVDDIAALRALFPIVQHQAYLMNAAQSPLNARSQAAISSYLDMAAQDLDARPDVRGPIRALLAELLGGQAADYALTTSTGAGISTVAAGLGWRAGDNVVLPSGEHWNCTFPWFNLKDRGVETRLVAPDAGNRVQLDAIAAQVNARTRIICLTAVRFDTGYRADLRALSDLAHAHGALLVVDGTQCAGAHRLDVAADGVDVLAGAGFKWLMGLAGTGFLYVNATARAQIAPIAPGMFAAEHSFSALNYHDDARRYETGTLAYTLLHGWAEGLRLLRDIGIKSIAARNLMLTDRLIAGLQDAGKTLLTPVATPAERSAIVSFTTGSKAGDTALFERLAQAKVQVSLRQGALRAAPNFFNTEDEIDRLLACL